MRVLLILLILFSPLSALRANASTLEDRRISAIELEGLSRVDQQRVINLIQAAVGQPYDYEVVEGDVYTLNNLGEFNYIAADVVLQEDGSVQIIYTFREHQIITEVSIVGNTLISDKELLFALPVMAGLGRDEDAIDRGRRRIMEVYQERGNYLVEVTPEVIVYGKDVDEFTGKRIDESIVLIYRIMEGPRVRVKSISFMGNNSFSEQELSAEIDTNISIPFFRRGELNETILEADVNALRRFYMNRGFRDVRVSYDNPLSPSDKEAAVIFIIEEGPQYTIGGISVQFNTAGNLSPVFSEAQIAGLIPINVGDVYRDVDVQKAIQAINNAYGVLGRIVNVAPHQQAVTRAKQNMFGSSSLQQDVTNATPYHAEPGASIEIMFTVDEGLPTKVGLVEIVGNNVTHDKVIRGRIDLRPGEPFDITAANRSEVRLMQTRLFRDVSMTIQPENPNNPGVRDLLVEVEEMRTGSVGFGVLAGSDSGFIGNISIDQRNFDIADTPESFEELIRGKSFLGAGQKFHMAIQPGEELFNYEIGLTDPRFLDSDYSFGGSARWTQRLYQNYTQETVSSSLTLGKRFGDIWYGAISLDSNRIKLTEFDDDVPQEIFDDAGPSDLESVGFLITRDTLTPVQRPYEGSKTRLTLNQFGMTGGDYSFSKAELRYTAYFATVRDFLDRTTTLRFDARLGYIFGGSSPTYEKFTYGGRTLRGFEYRSVSPKGTPRVAGGDASVPIGGDWAMLLTAQYEFPVFDRFMSMVLFCDAGTVTEKPELKDYRVSLGTGVRLYIPQLGNVPLAFDFGFPVVKEELDKKKMFSFSVQLPF